MGVRIRIATALCVTVLSIGASAAAPPERDLVRGAIAATGTRDPIDVTLEEIAVERALDRIEGRLGGGRPSARRARRLHELLQKGYLRRYEADADGLDAVLERGAYNCLSATLLYGLAARRLGYEVRVLERPGHLRVRLHTAKRPIDIETTQRYGFDVAPFPDAAPAPGSDETRAGGRGVGAYRDLPLESAVGFAWLNRAWRELEAGHTTRAAEHASAAARDLAAASISDGDELQRLFARAFLEPYEAGRFDEALEIARLDAAAFPEATTSRDRLLAAAAKVIEDASDRDDPARAETVLEDTASRLDGTRDSARIVRQAAPVVTAAAVRNGDFVRAARLAARYAAVEPDPVEGARLRAWVEARSAGDVSASAPFTTAAASRTCTSPEGGSDP